MSQNHSVLNSLYPPEESRPVTIVLRPNGCLGGTLCESLQRQLDAALELTQDTVVVDLLWVDDIQTEGIETLVAGLQKATRLGKTLSLRSLDLETRAALTVYLEG